MKKLIVITSPYFFKGEDCILSHLFDEGMQHLHLRKPDSEQMNCASCWIGFRISTIRKSCFMTVSTWQ